MADTGNNVGRIDFVMGVGAVAVAAPVVVVVVGAPVVVDAVVVLPAASPGDGCWPGCT